MYIIRQQMTPEDEHIVRNEIESDLRAGIFDGCGYINMLLYDYEFQCTCAIKCTNRYHNCISRKEYRAYRDKIIQQVLDNLTQKDIEDILEYYTCSIVHFYDMDYDKWFADGYMSRQEHKRQEHKQNQEHERRAHRQVHEQKYLLALDCIRKCEHEPIVVDAVINRKRKLSESARKEADL